MKLLDVYPTTRLTHQPLGVKWALPDAVRGEPCGDIQKEFGTRADWPNSRKSEYGSRREHTFVNATASGQIQSIGPLGPQSEKLSTLTAKESDFRKRRTVITRRLIGMCKIAMTPRASPSRARYAAPRLAGNHRAILLLKPAT